LDFKNPFLLVLKYLFFAFLFLTFADRISFFDGGTSDTHTIDLLTIFRVIALPQK